MVQFQLMNLLQVLTHNMHNFGNSMKLSSSEQSNPENVKQKNK